MRCRILIRQVSRQAKVHSEEKYHGNGSSKQTDSPSRFAGRMAQGAEALLAREKAATRERDEIARLRRELPWVRVEKEYVFDDEAGEVKLADLFDGRSQLVVYHFMFDPEWSQGCKSCSLLADHYNPAVIHLEHRDATMITVSRAPLEKLLAFRQRMGWTFRWVSSNGNDFNHDFQVSFTRRSRLRGCRSTILRRCRFRFRRHRG